jgi:hypothetical protein
MRPLMLAMVLPLLIAAGPTTRRVFGPAPVIESTGPLHIARYAKPFAAPLVVSSASYYDDRHYFATPTYGYSCYGYDCYGYGWCGFFGYGYCGWSTTGLAASGAYSPGW